MALACARSWRSLSVSYGLLTDLPSNETRRAGTRLYALDSGRQQAAGQRDVTILRDTQRHVRRARTRLLRERDTGAAIDPSRQTVAEFIRDEWLPSRAPTTGRAGRGHRGKVGIQTWDSYRGDLERHVIPRIGGIALQKLTPSDLNRLYDEIEQSGGQRGVGWRRRRSRTSTA